jgi:RNA polymerase sigma-70 factor (ECF subfamily)
VTGQYGQRLEPSRKIFDLAGDVRSVDTGEAAHNCDLVGEPEFALSDPQIDRFRALYESHYSTIYAFVLRRLVGARDDASDVAAEIFATAWRRLAQIPAPPEDRLWLYGVARRVLNRHQRGLGRRIRLLRRLQAEASIGIKTEDSLGTAGTDRERVRAAIDRLKPDDRDVLSLVLWEQLSHSEAAQVLGCSVNAVGLRLHKAKSRLRAQLTARQQQAVERPRGRDDLPTKGIEDEP